MKCLDPPECGHGLLVVDVGWTDGGNHHRFTVAAQGILQQFGQHGLAVVGLVRRILWVLD